MFKGVSKKTNKVNNSCLVMINVVGLFAQGQRNEVHCFLFFFFLQTATTRKSDVYNNNKIYMGIRMYLTFIMDI